MHARALRLGMAAALVAAAAAIAPEAAAWGPRTSTTISSAAGSLLNEAGVAGLSARQRDIVRGASLSREELEALVPLAASDPLAAITQEMFLLQAVRGQGIDAYFAYRLGVLGQLVARYTAPLAEANSVLREQYFDDVDSAIARTAMPAGRRLLVEPAAYFSRVRAEVADREVIILSDYDSGLGFDGIARAAMPQDVARSAHAVTDVWYTIFRGTATLANLPESQLQRYIIDGLQYYATREGALGLDAAYDRFMAMAPIDADLRKRIGDMFFENGQRERAVAEYKRVVDENPSRRDVVERIAEHYVLEGDAAMNRGELEVAQVAYAEALRFDMLHPNAQAKKLQTERQIRERETRLMADEDLVETAAALQREADVNAGQGEFALAMDRLQEAMRLYQSVSEEFAGPRATAGIGINTVNLRINELKNQLIANAITLSGSGASIDARIAAEAGQRDTNDAALRRLAEQQYEAEIDRLRRELGGPIMDAAQAP